MIPDKTFVNQGSGMQRGVSPLGGETFLWTAAMVIREVILLCPENLDMEERKEYFSELAFYLKEQFRLTEEKATNLEQQDFRTPWLVAMCGYVYNRTHNEADWSTSAYHQVFKFSRRVSATIATTLTDDLKLALNTFEMKSSNDFFWLSTIDRFNNERAKAGKEALEPSSGPYPVPRAAEWDYIYDHFKVDLRFSASPPVVTSPESDVVDLVFLDFISQQYEQARAKPEQPFALGPTPANTSSEQNQAAEGSKGTKKRPRISSSDNPIPIATVNSDDDDQTQDHSPPNEGNTTGTGNLKAKKRRTEGPDEVATAEIQRYPSGSAKGKERALPVEEDMDVDGSDQDVHATSNRHEDEQETQTTGKKKIIVIYGDNTDPGALVYPFVGRPIQNVGILEWDVNDLNVPLAFLSQIPFIKFIFVLQVAPIACTACIAGNLPCMIFLGAFHPCYGCKANGRGCSHCPRANNKLIADKDWCWWLTTIHHAANVLELSTRRGPRHVLPSYDGITFPPFPRELAKDFRISLSTKQIKDNWEAIMAEPPASYLGVPHAKVAKMNKDGNRPVRERWPCLGEDNEQVTLDLYNVYSDWTNGVLGRLWAVGYVDGWIKEANFDARPRGRPRATTVKVVPSPEATLEGRTVAQKPSAPTPAKSRSGGARQSSSTQQARREYSRVPEDSGVDNEPIVIEDTPPKKKATKTSTSRKPKGKQPKAGPSSRGGKRQQSPDEEDSDVSEPQPTKRKGKATASGSAKAGKAAPRRIVETSQNVLPSIGAAQHSEIEQLKLTVRHLEKKIDDFIAAQPDPLDENYIAEYVTGKVDELFTDMEQGPLSGIVAVLSQFEAVLTNSTQTEDQRGNLLVRRHDALHRKADTILSKMGQSSSLDSGSTVSHQIVNEISPMLQQAITTTVLQQVSAEVKRTMQEFWTNMGGNEPKIRDAGEEDPIQPTGNVSSVLDGTIQPSTANGETSGPPPSTTTVESEVNDGNVGVPAMNTPSPQELPATNTPSPRDISAVSGLHDECMNYLTDSPQQLDETGFAQAADADVYRYNESDMEEEEGQIIE